MTYQVLARKWRPQEFDTVVGQEPVTRTLRNALVSGRVAHAYLFTGPARRRQDHHGAAPRQGAVLHRARRRPRRAAPVPRAADFVSGAPVDVMEIDAASNTGVDDIRTLRENVKYSPARGRFKVYIVDEVHMLSGPAFNAFLKTLEEPPAARRLHPGDHRPEEDPGHRAVALPALRLQADLARIAHREPQRHPRQGGRALRAVGAARCSCGRPRAACATRCRCSTPPSPTARASSTRRASRNCWAPPRRCTCAPSSRPCSPVTAERRSAAIDRAAEAGEDLGGLCREVVEVARRLLVLKAAPSAEPPGPDGGRSRGASIRGRAGERRRGDLPAPGLPRRRCGDAALAASARRARDRRGARDPPPRAADARHAPRQGRGRARPVPRGSARCRSGAAPAARPGPPSFRTASSRQPRPHPARSPRPVAPAATPASSPERERPDPRSMREPPAPDSSTGSCRSTTSTGSTSPTG